MLNDGWFPKFWPDGSIISGSEEPTPIDNEWFVYNGGPRGLIKRHRHTGAESVAYADEVIELAGGAGMWAARRAPLNAVIWSFRPDDPIPNAGQPALDDDGNFIYRIGDDYVEPDIDGNDRVWCDGRGRVIWAHASGREDITLDTPEGHPRVSKGAVVTMTGTDLLVRPFPASKRGWRIKCGENRNLNPQILVLDGIINLVWFDRALLIPQKRQIRFTDPMEDLAPPAIPVPTPTPLPEPTPVPTTPDHRFVLDAVNRDHPELLRENTHESCGLFTELAVLALHALDGQWGHVRKPADGRNAYNGHAVDAIKYLTSGQVIDIISGAGDRVPTGPAWGPTGSREDEPWMAPTMPQDDPREPIPDEPDLPPACQCEALLGRLESLERLVQVHEADLIAQGHRFARLERDLFNLANQPPRQYVAEVSVEEVRPNPFRAHSHRVEVKINPA
jgi:hypothetical protein